MLLVVQLIAGEIPFTVYFQPRKKAPSSPEGTLLERVQSAAISSLKSIQAFFSAFKKVICHVYTSRGLLFRTYVLHSPLTLGGGLCFAQFPSNLYIASLQFIEGMGSLLCRIVLVTYEVFSNRKELSSLELQSFVGEGIDVSHFQLQEELPIDMSQVPKSVELKNLSLMFKQINFDTPSAPGYVSLPFSKLDKEQLGKGLDIFIKHVTNQVPFMGTPRADENTKLKIFYETIENKTRFLMYRLNKNLIEFVRKNRVIEECSEAGKKEFNDLLETKAQFVRDLALAGFECGAHYAAITEHWYQRCNSVVLGEHTTLKDSLFAWLAKERRKIAEEEAQLACGRIEKDPKRQEAMMVHYYNQYLQTFGPFLKFPGTSGVIEHILQNTALPQRELLRLFFKKYTVNRIIESVLNHYENSEDFRNKIFDWIREGAEDWKKEATQALCESRVKKITELKDQALREMASGIKKSYPLLEFIDHLGFAHIQSLYQNNLTRRDAFIEAVFTCTHAQRWLHNVPDVKAFKACFDNIFPLTLEGSEEEVLSQIEKRLFFLPTVKEIVKITEGFVPLETVEKVLNETADITEVVTDACERERRQEFLTEVLGDYSTQKTSAWIEWLLVSHGVFFPQPSYEGRGR